MIITYPSPDIHPPVGELRLIQDVVLPNGLHRMQFEQRGAVPDADALRAQYAPTDGRFIHVSVWMDEAANRGYVYMAWKEWQQERFFPLQEGETKSDISANSTQIVLLISFCLAGAAAITAALTLPAIP